MNEARVLYIEDNPANLMLVKKVLMVEGFEVVEADNAPLGIELAQRDPPDLILMDINLPEMDGLTATGKLRAISALDDVPIIALTASVMKDDLEKAEQAGCDGFIGKPIDIDKLPDQLRKYLRSKREHD